MEWQGIETAPEQERILVSGWQEPTRSTKGYWWIHESMIWDGELIDFKTAKYWMPLPKPPKGFKCTISCFSGLRQVFIAYLFSKNTQTTHIQPLKMTLWIGRSILFVFCLE